MSGKFVVIILCFLRIVLCDQQAQEQQQTDSYLSALHESHATGAGVRSPRDDLSPGYDSGPKPIYGPPTSYGPSAPVYGPPTAYGPPTGFYRAGPPKYYAAVHHRTPTDWLLDKLHFKLDLVTIGKIILKLIIFKKIVKFIAILCLLLFLPKLNMMGSSSTDHNNHHDHDYDISVFRKFNVDESKNARINELTSFVLSSIDAFTRKEVKCPQNSGEMSCRLNRMLTTIDSKYPLKRIFRYYKPPGHAEEELPPQNTPEMVEEGSGTDN
uniref:Uncharacterized protein n=1 Tax=Lutzomyia longipalpis TaxID=7200 RepID=A0A1B0CS33_LUTLO